MANLTIDAQFNAVGSVITGKVHDTGVATIEVFEVETNTSISSTTSDANGNFTASLSKSITDGSKARVVATSGSDTGSVEISGPNVAPDAPYNVMINEEGTQITGKAEPNGTVTCVDQDGILAGTVTADSEGNFLINLSPPKLNGEQLSITVIDRVGNSSPSTYVTARDITPPVLYNVVLNADGDEVTGNTDPYTIVKAVMYDQVEGETTSSWNGSFKIKMQIPATDYVKVYVTAYDVNKNPSETVTLTATKDTIAADLIAYLAADSRTITARTEPGITVVVRNPITGEEIKRGTTDEQGNITIVLDSVLFRGKSVDVVAVDQAYNESDPINLQGTFALENPRITNFSISPLGNVVNFNTNKEIKSAVMINNTTGVTTPFYVEHDTHVTNAFPHPVTPGDITIKVVDTDNLVATLSFFHQGFDLVHATKDWVTKNVVLVPEPPTQGKFTLEVVNGIMYWKYIDN